MLLINSVCYGAPGACQSYNYITQQTIPQQERWEVQLQGRTIQQSSFYLGNWGTGKSTARRSTVRGFLNIFRDSHLTDLPMITPKICGTKVSLPSLGEKKIVQGMEVGCCNEFFRFSTLFIT